MKCWYFDSQLTTWGLSRNHCFFFMFRKSFCIKKRRRQKLMTLLVKQVLYSFEMRKYYASFVEINMILRLKSQLQPFNSWNMRYSSSKFCNSYLLRNFTFIKALFFITNWFSLSSVSFSFFDFLNPMTTVTTYDSCSFQIKCSIHILTIE